MLDVSPLVELLGRSEKDPAITRMLEDFGIKTPLKRPKRGDDQVNFETSSGLEFCFVKAESFDNFSNQHPEGELIFSTLFLFPSRLQGKDIKLPLGLTFDISRELAHQKMGPPEWSGRVLNNDRWTVNGFHRILLSFTDDDASIDEITISSDVIADTGAAPAVQTDTATEIDANHIIGLFGLPSDDAQVEALFTDLNADDRPSLPEEDDEDDDDSYVFHDWVLVKRKGLELGFEDAAYREASDRSSWGQSELLLTQVYLYTAFNDIEQFHGILPFGLTFLDGPEQARTKLASYENTRHSYHTDTWDIGQLRLNITYTEQKTSIEKLACWLKPEPLQPEETHHAPPLDAIVTAFGEKLDTENFLDLWGDAITEDHIEEALEYNEIDLTYELGATLHFAAKKRSSRVFKAITLHADRDQNAIQWAGQLPQGLTFDDSPQTLFTKMQTEPEHHENSGLTGSALWHLENCTMHVLYSNLYNRILHVKLFAPGT